MIILLTTSIVTFSAHVPHPNPYCYDQQVGDTIERICYQEPHNHK